MHCRRSRAKMSGWIVMSMQLAAAIPAFPIAIQYAGYSSTGSSTYTGVVNLNGCSGVLLADGMHVLTAAHCAGTIASPDNVHTVITPFNNMTAGFFTQAFPNVAS